MMPVFSPDGSRIVYTVITGNLFWDTGRIGSWRRAEVMVAKRERPPVDRFAPSVVLGNRERDSMRLVETTEGRTDTRIVYVPESIRGMAHRSYLSPDRKNVLGTEMDNAGMIPCRLIPYDAIQGPGRGSRHWTMHARRMVSGW